MTDEEIIEAIRTRVSEGRPTDSSYGEAPFAPASEEAIAEAERVIGYPLPPLLLRIYREIGNGGVGPALGIEGLRGGYTSDGPNMIDMYLLQREPNDDPWYPPPLPPGVLLFCDFGCATWSGLDCRHPQGQMWWWDAGDRNKLDLTLPEWLKAWLTGDINEIKKDPALMLADESWSRSYED